VDPEAKHMISVIVQSGDTKFDTENDLVRSAITWFIYDKFKKFHEGRLDEDVRRMMARVQKAQHLSRVYDLEKFKNANRDALLKMWAMGAQDDALGWYSEMLEEARNTHSKFWREIQLWAKSDPALGDIRAAWVRAGKELAAMEEDEERGHAERGRPAGKKKPRRAKK
jgi:hypothetical protein